MMGLFSFVVPLAQKCREPRFFVFSGVQTVDSAEDRSLQRLHRGDLSSDRFILFQHSLLCHKTATFMTFFIQL